MNEIKKHVFVCVNERNERSTKGCCASKDSLEIMTQLKKLIKGKGIKERGQYIIRKEGKKK